MDDDTDGKADLAKLSKREDFPGFKEPMNLYAMEKGDTEGIYSDDGSDPTVGYQAIPAAHVNRRRDWMLLSGKLTGRVGLQITNPTLRSTWNAAITSAIANDKKAYQFALSLAAVERACGGVQETARQIARSRFKVALASFEEKSGEDGKKAGFEVYADTIRLAEEKLSHAGVVMTDGEKKEKFYAGFNPRNSEWQTCKTFWHQSSDLAFDNILARGVQQQQSLDATAAEEQAFGVRSLVATAAPAATAAIATTDFDTEKRRETGSSTDLDAHGARKPGSSTGDDEIGKIRQQIIGFKRIRDDDLITEDESAAKRKQLFGL